VHYGRPNPEKTQNPVPPWIQNQWRNPQAIGLKMARICDTKLGPGVPRWPVSCTGKI